MIKENYQEIIKNVEKSANDVGKSLSDIQIIGVTKTVDISSMKTLYDLGIKTFGESKVQELLPKIEALPDDISWHFIGNLQSNKVKQIVGKVDLIQSVDSIKLLDEINKCAEKLGIVQNILLEINIGDESTKSGIKADETYKYFEHIKGLNNIFLTGLMCIPPNTGNNAENVENFNKMRKLFVDNSNNCCHNIHMDNLSMGMSSDYSDAIAHGSNMVRIGQAFFGKRI